MKTAKQTENRLLDKLVKLMDSAVVIPGTNIRFGLDALIGLIPGAGDATSMLISGGLILMMARKGITAKLAMQMLGNVAVDYVVGSIPLLGDVFDVGFKANQRNLELLNKHHENVQISDSSSPNLTGIFLMVIFCIVIFVIGAVFISYKIGELILGLF